MISENRKKLISELVKYKSKKYIESVICLLDTEDEVEKILHFVIANPKASKTDIHEEIIKLKFSKK